MRKQNKKQRYKEQVKTIENEMKDEIPKAEAKLLLRVLIFHFDGFARQQQLVNEYMSTEYHWGNKRTARVLKTLSDIGVLDRSRSEDDNWTLFFVVKGFFEKCRERIELATIAIRERIRRCRYAIFSFVRVRKERFGT